MKMITTRNKSIQLSAMFINFRGKPRQNNVNAAVFSFSIFFLLFVRNIIIIYMLRATMKPQVYSHDVTDSLIIRKWRKFKIQKGEYEWDVEGYLSSSAAASSIIIIIISIIIIINRPIAWQNSHSPYGN